MSKAELMYPYMVMRVTMTTRNAPMYIACVCGFLSASVHKYPIVFSTPQNAIDSAVKQMKSACSSDGISHFGSLAESCDEIKDMFNECEYNLIESINEGLLNVTSFEEECRGELRNL